MSIGANSYGDTTSVAHLVPMHTDNTTKLFTTSTRPTLARVESLIDQVSGMVNMFLAENGFTIPVAQADAVLSLSLFVNEEVAGLVEGINGSGRFGPTSKQPGGRFGILYSDVQTFIESVANGFVALGVPRPRSITAGLGYRDTDEAGNDIFPLFTRTDYGFDFVNQEPA